MLTAYILLTLDTAPLCETLKIHETSPRDCTMCMNQYKDPVYGLPCGHYFCKSCINCFIEKSGICPQCSHEKLFRGNQPVGYMTWRTESRKSLPGYETCGTIVVTYNFKEGIQGNVNLKSFCLKVDLFLSVRPQINIYIHLLQVQSIQIRVSVIVNSSARPTSPTIQLEKKCAIC